MGWRVVAQVLGTKTGRQEGREEEGEIKCRSFHVQATEYTDLGYVTEFRYGPAMTRAVQDFGSFKNVGVGGGMLDSGHALVFVDNHDNQRGHGAGGNMVTFHRPDDYKLVQVSN